MNDFIENAIFICGHRKSGTTLLVNLLDGHPELSVYPTDSGFFYMYYPLCKLENFSDDKKIEVMKNKIIGNLEDEFQNLSEEERKKINFEMEKFKDDFITIAKKTAMTPKDMLSSLALAYKKNFMNLTTEKKWVEKTTSTEIYAIDVFNWFPNAKFIHVIRDPRDNWGSLKSGWKKRYAKFNDSKERLLQSLIDRGRLGMEMARWNEKIIGKEKYLVVKYEDLAENPTKIMKKITEFLDIKFDEILLKPTICGQLWVGNNFDGLKFTKVSNVNVDRWKQRIDEEEAKLIEYYFSDIMQHFGYNLEYSLEERVKAAKEHYKWFNFAQIYSHTS